MKFNFVTALWLCRISGVNTNNSFCTNFNTIKLSKPYYVETNEIYFKTIKRIC